MNSFENRTFAGWWSQGEEEPLFEESALRRALSDVIRPVALIRKKGRLLLGRGGIITLQNSQGVCPGEESGNPGTYPLAAYVPPLHPDALGDPDFKKIFNLRYAYVVGAMANGITSVEMVEKAGRSGMLGFYGAAGLGLDKIDEAISRLKSRLNDFTFGFNLIHSPNNFELEDATVKLYLKRGINFISASAFMDLSLPLVYFRVKGLHRDSMGEIVCPNRIVGKVSRIEVAEKFFSPPPDKFIKQLLDKGMITDEEAELSRAVSMADALTAEADSGGHTDNRPAFTILPTMISLRDRIAAKYKLARPVFVGLGGGIATPESTASAFAMGAAYVLTGSINQACIEAGTSDIVKAMLADARQADVTMSPAADMFELGVKVQVLKRGTMFPLKSAKLYNLYSSYGGLDDLPEMQRRVLEKDFFRCSLDEEWEQTKDFFSHYDPKQIARAENDPKHKMALVFRSYLGRSSVWSIQGDQSRKIDFQIWCGPAIGAFNEWAKGSFLEKPENRKTVTVAMNLLLGAAFLTRINWLTVQGVSLPPGLGKYTPVELSQIGSLLEENIHETLKI
jgi:PfaD family protein